MKITFTGNRGRSTITNSVDIKDISSEDDLQDLFLEFIDFLQAMGADLPDEMLDVLEDYDNGSN